MPRKRKKGHFTLLETIFTIFLPLLAFSAVMVLLASLLLTNQTFKARQPEQLEAQITDGHFQRTEEVAYFNNQRIKVPGSLQEEKVLAGSSEALSANQEDLSVNQAEKWIEINLTMQKLYAREGDRIVYEFPISSGKWARTPTGEFRIWSKLKYTKMSGGSKHDNTYYYLPNVPYTQYFYRGFALHGTYWHNNFGHPMSHGCINMYTPDAEIMFYWTSPSVPDNKWVVYPTQNSPGTRVVVRGVAPWE